MAAAVEVARPARAAGRGWQRWLVPDLSLWAALVALVYCFLFFDGMRGLFRDSDSGWHIRTGETILATGSLPRTDPYSFTRAGQPWVAWEWGADLAMALAHRAAGLSGVALFYGLTLAAAVWLWVRLHWIAGGNFFLACAMAAPMLTTTNLHWLARPHLLGWVLLLASLAFLLRGHAWWPAALLGAVWANVHASFLLLPAMALAFALGGRRRWYLLVALSALLGSLANPYGWNLHRHVVSYLLDSELLARIGEFQRFNFGVAGGGQILAAVGLAGLGAALLAAQSKLGQALVVAGLLALALRSARGLPLVALAGLPLANGAITEALGAWPWLRGFLDYSARLRRIDAGFHGAALAPLIVLAAAVFVLPAQAGFPPQQFPVAAAAAVDKLPPEARLLAPDKFGGYLIYRFAGARKVYFDGRSDFYGAAFLKEYGRLVALAPGWQRQLDCCTHALLPNSYPLLAALERLGWRRLYRDGFVTLLERPFTAEARRSRRGAAEKPSALSLRILCDSAVKAPRELWTARKLS